MRLRPYSPGPTTGTSRWARGRWPVAGGRPIAQNGTSAPTIGKAGRPRPGPSPRASAPGRGAWRNNAGSRPACPQFESPTGKALAQTGQVTCPGPIAATMRLKVQANRPRRSPRKGRPPGSQQARPCNSRTAPPGSFDRPRRTASDVRSGIPGINSLSAGGLELRLVHHGR